MLNELLIWVALLVGIVCLAASKRRERGPLTLAYFLILSLGHVPGVLAYLDPGFHLSFREATKLGFDTTLIGMTAFFVGAAVAAWLLPPRRANAKAYQQAASAEFFSRIGRRMLTTGIVAYFIIMPLSGLVPSATAIVSGAATLLSLSFFLRLYVADSRQKLSILATGLLLPLSTLVTGGFIGFGTIWLLTITAFCFVMARRRIWFYLAAPPIIFLGLSLFVTYAQLRNEIREVVWDASTGIVERLDEVSKLLSDFQLLDLSNEHHKIALDERLNQNYLVGMGVVRHRENGKELFYGATVPVWALIPRAIWPDKPAVGGGQDWVTQFTGIRFAEGTSVGVGQVLEFYMNFGMPGVLAGFAVLGFILMRLDQKTMCALAARNIPHLLRWALPGLALLSPMGNLMEILVSVVSAMVLSQFLIYSNLLGSLSAQSAIAKISGQPMRMVMRR